MNFNLNYEGFEEYFVDRKDRLFDGVQYLFRFENRYGASVVKGDGTYGYDKDLWEIAVILWCDDEYDIDYDSEITSDIEGWLTDADVRDLLKQIKEL